MIMHDHDPPCSGLPGPSMFFQFIFFLRSGLFRCADARRDAEACFQAEFPEKNSMKNIETGLKQVVVPPFEAISTAIDSGAPPAPF